MKLIIIQILLAIMLIAFVAGVVFFIRNQKDQPEEAGEPRRKQRLKKFLPSNLKWLKEILLIGVMVFTPVFVYKNWEKLKGIISPWVANSDAGEYMGWSAAQVAEVLWLPTVTVFVIMGMWLGQKFFFKQRAVNAGGTLKSSLTNTILLFFTLAVAFGVLVIAGNIAEILLAFISDPKGFLR